MKSSKKIVIVIVGATGSGKTDLSIALAQHYNAPIISTDSRQVYKGMPICTAQPTKEQLNMVEHHFIASCDITDKFNCGIYEEQAISLLDELFKKHDFVVAVGGSGLYIKALCEGLDDLPTIDPQLRQMLSERLKNEGLDKLVDELQHLDPDYYAVVDKCNSARVLRALEICIQSGHAYSQLRKGAVTKRNFEVVKVGIEIDRALLYERINRRVDQMVCEGLEAEARSLYEFRGLNSLQTVGLSELFNFFDGTTNYEEAIELIKRNSRRYAKRQMTWFRSDKDVVWYSHDKILSIISHIDFCYLK